MIIVMLLNLYGNYQPEFYEYPLFCMLTANMLQLMFLKGLNQLDFFCNVANHSGFFKINMSGLLLYLPLLHIFPQNEK